MSNSPLVLRAVSRTSGLNRALKQNPTTPGGLELDFEEVPVLVQAFRRMVRGLEWDVCEMAVTTYLCARSFGSAMVALPVFLVRGLHHQAITTHPSASVRSPSDLEGRCVGVARGWTVTTGVWARGILAEHYGVRLDTIRWRLSGDEHVEAYQPPPYVSRLPEGSDLVELLTRGELAAVVGADIAGPELRPVVADPEAEGLKLVSESGIYPINHLVVVKEELLLRHPELGADLFRAFTAAKKPYLEWLQSQDPSDLGGMDRTNALVMRQSGQDPVPYGLEANKKVLEKLVQYALDQKILSSPPRLEDLFDPATIDLEG